MKKSNSFTRLMLVVLALFMAVPSIMAYNFKEGGIYYNDCGNNQVQVTFKDENYNSYSGNVNIPSTVTHNGKIYSVCGIESHAFYNCTELTSVTIPNSVTAIGDNAFAFCRALKSATIGHVNSIDAICGCWESNYGYDNGYVYDINDEDIIQYKFNDDHTGLFTYFWKNIQESIDFNWEILNNTLFIFYSDGNSELLCYKLDENGYLLLALKSEFRQYTAYRPVGTTSIGDHAFHECENLKDLAIGNIVASIGDYAFYMCTSLNVLNIPNTVETIGNCAFLQCQGLTYLSLGSGVETIGHGAFGGAWQLVSITSLAATPPAFDNDDSWTMFNSNVYEQATLYVPKASIPLYRDASIWQDFVNIKATTDKIRGDVNGDDEVNIADVNAVIKIILGSGSNPNADVNGDGEINIADVNAIINIILNPEIEHEWVDLGLPSGTLWATCNIGANKPEEYGDYFAWGETTPKDTYSWKTYKWCEDGNQYATTKYDTWDGRLELEPEDDAANVNWGSSWRMPSSEQIEELINSCTWQWTSLNGVNGNLGTAPNGNTIFLPAAGRCYKSSFFHQESSGYSWSRTLSSTFDWYANYLYSSSGLLGNSGTDRYYGLTIRAVRVSQ